MDETDELKHVNAELVRTLLEKVEELEAFFEVTVGRELKMIQVEKDLETLRKENAALRQEVEERIVTPAYVFLPPLYVRRTPLHPSENGRTPASMEQC